MNIFIDTNIYLTFYHLSTDDLEELEKISVLQRNGNAKIYLPKQVEDEFYRNREGTIADCLKIFKEEKLNDKIPQIVKAYADDFKTLVEAKRNFNKAKEAILGNISKDVSNRTLKADEICESIFSQAETIKITDSILEKAKFRFDRGNPPGKNKSYGDAINWESLLKQVPKEEDLHIITDDRDFFSKLNNYELNDFLAREWKEKKDSKIYIYDRISPFLRVHFPNINLTDEIEKEIVIERLYESGSFSQTHRCIEVLSSYESFSPLQVNRIISAYLTNSQINWIIEDEDVQNFIKNIISTNKDVIYEDTLEAIENLLRYGSMIYEDDPYPENHMPDEIPF